MCLVLSAFTSSPISLLAAIKASAFSLMKGGRSRKKYAESYGMRMTFAVRTTVHILYSCLCVEVQLAQARLISVSICLVCLIPAHGTGYSCRNLYPLHACDAWKIWL